MINTEQKNRIREEGYTARDMLKYLLHIKGSVKPENHILFALSLTSDMKALARTQMQRVKKVYKKNEKKYKAERGEIMRSPT